MYDRAGMYPTYSGKKEVGGDADSSFTTNIKKNEDEEEKPGKSHSVCQWY